LLVIDVDHFKVINDTHGHLLGDRVLRAIGQILQANIKGRDIAARLGGEEFAVLLLGTSSQGAQVLAEQIRLAVARGRIRRIDGTELVGAITVSIGIASARAGEDFDALLARTDAALYRAKRDGRNLVRLAE
jgi:diguanylate cyclase